MTITIDHRTFQQIRFSTTHNTFIKAKANVACHSLPKKIQHKKSIIEKISCCTDFDLENDIIFPYIGEIILIWHVRTDAQKLSQFPIYNTHSDYFYIYHILTCIRNMNTNSISQGRNAIRMTQL